MSSQRAAARRLIREALPADALRVTIGGTGRDRRVLIGILGRGHVALTGAEVTELVEGLAILHGRLDVGRDASTS